MSFRVRGMRGSQPACPAVQGAEPCARSTGASRYDRNPLFQPTTPAYPGKAQLAPEGVKPLAEQGVSPMAFPPLASAAGTMAQSGVQVAGAPHVDGSNDAGGWWLEPTSKCTWIGHWP